MNAGSCLCGAVRYEFSGGLETVVSCHCSQCRKASGTAFATNASVSAEAFRFVAGKELLGEFESSPGQYRCFCTRCGSPIIKRYRDHPEVLRVRIGTLDTDPQVEVKKHIFLREKAPWARVPEGVEQLE
ncbi:MAG: GFA family protein [Myxococcota bacterium]|jgi:hypothetical protein|nr:GFA family protein [Myxococcota bacterium]